MSKIKLTGHASGTGVLEITAPNTSTDRTITLPDSTGTLATTADSVGGANGVDFNDNVKARFGTGNDLEIYHDGTHSYIKDVGTGDLRIKGTDLSLRSDSADEPYINCTENGSVSVFHNNSKKLETTATGITVTGAIAGATNLGKLIKAEVVYNNNTRQVFSTSRGALITSENFCSPSNGYHYFDYTKSSASSTLVFHLSLSVGDVENQHVFGLWKTATASPTNTVTNFQRMAFDGSRNMGQGSATSTVMGATCHMTGLAAQQHHFYFAFGRSNDGSNVGYTLNPDTNNGSDKSGASNSQVVIYEIEM